MRAVPHKILDKEFSKSVRGYNPNEVDDFLDEIAEDFENLYRENGDLRDKIEDAHEKIEHYKKLEKNLQDTLVMAQTTAESLKIQAEKEAASILRDAESQSKQILQGIENEKFLLRREIDRLHSEYTSFRKRVLSFMESQMHSFQKASSDIERNSLVDTLRERNERTKSSLIQKEHLSMVSGDNEHTQAFEKIDYDFHDYDEAKG